MYLLDTVMKSKAIAAEVNIFIGRYFKTILTFNTKNWALTKRNKSKTKE
jgi:hypothetical protein